MSIACSISYTTRCGRSSRCRASVTTTSTLVPQVSGSRAGTSGNGAACPTRLRQKSAMRATLCDICASSRPRGARQAPDRAKELVKHDAALERVVEQPRQGRGAPGSTIEEINAYVSKHIDQYRAVVRRLPSAHGDGERLLIVDTSALLDRPDLQNWRLDGPRGRSFFCRKCCPSSRMTSTTSGWTRSPGVVPADAAVWRPAAARSNSAWLTASGRRYAGRRTVRAPSTASVVVGWFWPRTSW